MDIYVETDFDGCLVDSEPAFYKKVYSGTLNAIVEQERGIKGLEHLQYCREHYEARGEVALYGLGIPFKKWADALSAAPVDDIKPQPAVVQLIRSLSHRPVIFSGSPTLMIYRILDRLGFSPDQDFTGIIGWEEPEEFPLKWSCSPFVFQSICERFGFPREKTWCLGDNWQTDLLPPAKLGLTTVQIAKQTGSPDYYFPTIKQFLEFVTGD